MSLSGYTHTNQLTSPNGPEIRVALSEGVPVNIPMRYANVAVVAVVAKS
jgi:hypothetical protein